MSDKPEPGFYLATLTSEKGKQITSVVELGVSPDGPMMVGIMMVVGSMTLGEFRLRDDVSLGPRIPTPAEIEEAKGWQDADKLACPQCEVGFLIRDKDGKYSCSMLCGAKGLVVEFRPKQCRIVEVK